MEERRRCARLGGKLCDSTAARKTPTGADVHQRLTTAAQTSKGQRRHPAAAPLGHLDQSEFWWGGSRIQFAQSSDLQRM